MVWNADATRMPYRMHADYLRHMFLDNDLAEGRFLVDGRPVSIEDIAGPMFVVGTETDHVAPWRSVYKAHLLNKGDITFALTSGGHNAGIVSAPGHPNRHYALKRRPTGEAYLGPDDWLAAAEQQEGSWWEAWLDWMDRLSGQKVSPPQMGSVDKGYPPLADAPGTYVHQK
jgi:polyhydroxyalkanoate synthase